ncbi:MAG: hypothetical protein HYV99_09045 [Betaproteobacteria bacterium]|nr:hypothetical protein [Betaproteobacteria bacterium]
MLDGHLAGQPHPHARLPFLPGHGDAAHRVERFMGGVQAGVIETGLNQDETAFVVAHGLHSGQQFFAPREALLPAGNLRLGRPGYRIEHLLQARLVFRTELFVKRPPQYGKQPAQARILRQGPKKRRRLGQTVAQLREFRLFEIEQAVAREEIVFAGCVHRLDKPRFPL